MRAMIIEILDISCFVPYSIKTIDNIDLTFLFVFLFHSYFSY